MKFIEIEEIPILRITSSVNVDAEDKQQKFITRREEKENTKGSLC